MHRNWLHAAGTTVASGLLLLAYPSIASAQAPARYEATPQGRVLACFGEAYAMVELIDVATKNLAVLGSELRRTGADARPAIAAGLAIAGSQVDQRQALDVVERLEECLQGASRRAVPDAGAALAAQAVREEIDAAVMMAEGFISDYEELASLMLHTFEAPTEPAARLVAVRPFSTFGAAIRNTLIRSRALAERVIVQSTPKP